MNIFPIALLITLLTTVVSEKTAAMKMLEYITENFLKDSVPYAECLSHPAYSEEPDMFVQCSNGQICYYVAGDFLLDFGTYCDRDLMIGSGDGTEETDVVEKWKQVLSK